MHTGKVSLPLVYKLVGYHPWRHLEYIKFWVMHEWQSLGCYKDDVCNSRISKIRILHANPWSLLVSGKIFLYFCKKNAILAAILSAFFYLFFTWLQAKCLQLDSNFIANNLRKQMGLRHFFHITHFFTNNCPRSWTPSWIYRNAQWCQSGITRILQGQYMHYQNQQRKKV